MNWYMQSIMFIGGIYFLSMGTLIFILKLEQFLKHILKYILKHRNKKLSEKIEDTEEPFFFGAVSDWRNWK